MAHLGPYREITVLQLAALCFVTRFLEDRFELGGFLV